MRALSASVMLLTIAAPALAAQQRNTVVRTENDSVRVTVRVSPQSPEQLRALIAELTALTATQRDLEGQLRELMRSADRADGRRLLEVQERLARTWSEFYPRQSALTVACQSARSVPQGSGYIGVTFDDEMMLAEPQRGGGAVTIRFSTSPRISAVEPGSPAERAGLRAGDEWLALGSDALAGLSTDEIAARLRPGSKQQLRVRRDGRERTIEVTVAPRPGVPADVCERAESITLRSTPAEWRVSTSEVPRTAPVAVPGRVALPSPPSPPAVAPSRPLAFIAMSPTVYGARFRALDADAREFVSFRGEGVLVDQVAAGSPADAAGLRAFDVVSAANGAAVTAVHELLRITAEARRVELTVQRKGATRTVVLSR